jgi:hypothetical protein
MNRLRFTLAQLMLLVLIIGFGFAALQNANALWASVTFGVAVVSVAVALAGACSRTPAARMPWAAFAAAGGLSLVFWLVTSANMVYVDELSLFVSLQPFLNRQLGSGVTFVAYAQVSHSLDALLLGGLGAIVGQLLTPKQE